MTDKPPSMDAQVARALFPALGVAMSGRAGFFRISANNPNGMQELVVSAIDEVAWTRFVVPALQAAKLEVVEVGRG